MNQSVGLTSAEVTKLRAIHGANEISTHVTKPITVLLRQLNNPILWLLSGALLISGLLGDITNAAMILIIVLLSIGLGFWTEYRAEKANEDLHSRITHHATVIRDGIVKSVLISELVPGDLVKLSIGSVVPADLDLFEVDGLECDESVITGESMPVSKSATDSNKNQALMGTVVRIGTGAGIVTQIGVKTEFGKIASALGNKEPQTNFQVGLKDFSEYLLRIAILIITVVVFGNLYLKRPLIESILYALALAVGMTPQLLPAIVSTALAMGSHKLARNGVLIKRLVSIEDLGDVDILLTDKTGTLTIGEITYESSYQTAHVDPEIYGLLAIDSDYSEAKESDAGLSPLDKALWAAASSKFPENVEKLGTIPFDHNRRITSVLVNLNNNYKIISKGAPEDIITRCVGLTDIEKSLLDSIYTQGARVIAVAERNVSENLHFTVEDEKDLCLIGFLTFSDPAKPEIRESILELQALGIEVKIATGDSLQTTEHLCANVGLEISSSITGKELEALTDEQLKAKVLTTSIFARVSPEQKARVLAAIRANGKSIAYLGDGVNDAIALHDADVGISVDSAVDVAKDAADVVLLKKDLGLLATGVREGRQVFSNTMKYIFMATSADFGNMFSASIGSLILPFLPMLPLQVLLQDLMYDSSQLSIPNDRVDREQVARPSHWDLRQIKRFMLVFGLASSIFDFLTFGLLLGILHAKEAEFHTGWFIESLATATIVVLAIRTRRVPFFKSTPSKGLLFSIIGINVLAVILTYLPISDDLGLVPLPGKFYLALFSMVILYVVLVELAKGRLFRSNSIGTK
ncbi:MAG: magnesium-translocating P-type ATPase [Actinomycetota bacterium]